LICQVLIVVVVVVARVTVTMMRIRVVRRRQSAVYVGGSIKLGLEGEGLGGGCKIVSRLTTFGLVFKCCQVHIIHKGKKVAVEENEAKRGVGMHALCDASHSGLRHYSMKCGVDELKIDLYTRLDLHGGNIVGTKVERQFLVGTFCWSAF
jgi:hypothetical protein